MIAEIRLRALSQTEPGVGIVELLADDGAPGLGELWSADPEQAVEAVEALAPGVLGQRPLDRETLWQRMWSMASDWDGDLLTATSVVAGLDTALCDLAARQLGVPCVVLWGGFARARLELLLDCGPADDPVTLERAQALRADGVRAFSFDLTAPQPDAIRYLSRARKSLGTQALIAVNISQPPTSLEDATALGAAIDRVEPYWIEGLQADGKWQELARVRQAIISPTAGGMNTIGTRGLWRAVRAECTDVLATRLLACGGPTPALKVADAVALCGLRMCLAAGHTMVSALAAAHLAFARSVVSPLRLSPPLYNLLRQADPGLVADGFLRLPEAPGLGLPGDGHGGGEIMASFRA